ncbi:hypothetical protein SEA_BUZZBUZZ_36 [Mycobacterium phage BuzzBuzz]|nr:excisionase [Mycobacterium phage Bxz2]AGK87237.1 hypothetical protein PBI_METHUSELAH_36 [Mycobacterium phage Methuselah]AJA41820.1 hypothetical protein PBI_SPIKE509_37 [Mycobacterium phage Spike509]AJA41911.1 hypothetical protein PBI_PHOXY_37 [Mycobacterium phage Phoxy]ANU79371.1 hypothetical protein SEA_BUZZBUZZ_36 [Mycobacterium phage BuzzBuzz]AOZ64810.1 hypothetical protein SEA_LOUIE6_37 [Mycobacterium phage Louie6]ASM62455.1 hypothetical protein SEA_KADY_38 [Mycobacterium phage KADY]A
MRILSPVRVATGGTIAVGALAFSLSFTALADLATDNGVSSSQAWMVPLVIDGGVIVATAATLALRQSRWFAWSLLVLSSLVSVAGNVAHANATSGTVISMVIAAIPPLWLLAATHLTVMLSRQRSGNEAVPVAAEPLHIANAA